MTSATRQAVILEIPAPCDWITSNKRYHWADKATLTRQWRRAGYLYAREAQVRSYGELQVRIEGWIHKTTANRFDPLNWADTAKAAIDGLRDASVLVDDDWRHVLGPDMRAGRKRARNTLVLKIEVAS